MAVVLPRSNIDAILQRGKHRLYIGIFGRGGPPTVPNAPETFHWALLIYPKSDRKVDGMRFQTKNIVQQNGQQNGQVVWIYDEQNVGPPTTQVMLLAMVMVGKIRKLRQVVSVIRNVPIRGDDPGWNSVVWTEEALKGLRNSPGAMATQISPWQTLRDEIMDYMNLLIASHRFDGLAPGLQNLNQIATYDLLQGKQVIE